MGALCSKSSNLSGGHTLIDPQSIPNNRAPAINSEGRRAAVAEAAERRRQSVSGRDCIGLLVFLILFIQEQARGVNSSNPKSGQLSKKLEINKSQPRAPEGREEERLVVSS